jgi:hypothetical protein
LDETAFFDPLHSRYKPLLTPPHRYIARKAALVATLTTGAELPVFSLL